MEDTRVVIDTDILVDFLRGSREAVLLVSHFEERKFLLATTTINAFELYYGAHKSKEPEKAAQSTRQLLDRLVLLPLTSKSAQRAGHIYADLEKKGQPVGLRDTLIGAIALTRGYRVATRNKEHFEKIGDLQLIDFSE
jgi:tRNA(fMet)-specific endonuclease VapC